MKISHDFKDYARSKFRDDYELICFSSYDGLIEINYSSLEIC